MTVRTRPGLAALPGYRPGRTPKQVAQERGLSGAIKLASNESVFDPLPSVRSAIEAAGAINRYPDFHASALRQAVGQRYGVDPVQVVTGCGSVALCRNVVEATADPGDEVVVPALSFDVYASAATIAGATPVRVALQDHTLDLAAMADAITDRTRIVFVCNPNNPTSTAVRGGELAEFLDRVPDDILVVLDEAYQHFATGADAVDGMTIVAQRPNVVVLRTFSKAFGLAALRVGFGVASEDVADVLRKVTLPFSVSTIAEAAAVASLQPQAEAELTERIAQTVAERARVSAELRALGYDVPTSQANFVWLALTERAADFAGGCEERGVIVRGFAGKGVRVTIGTPEENDTFVKVAAELA